MLGYTNQFLTNDLKEQWTFRPFWSAVYLVWESECVSRVRCTRSAQEWHEYALGIQKGMEALRAHDAQNDEAETSRYWDGHNSEGVSEYVFRLVGDATGVEKATIRAEYDGVRALLRLWQARREQGAADEPSLEAALILFDAIVKARDGDAVLEYENYRELQGLRDLDQARHDFEVYIHGRRMELVKARYLPEREAPVIDARLAVLEALKKSEIEKAQNAVAEERRLRSSKGGAAVAKHYAERREKLIERFRETFTEYRSIAGAGAALGRSHGFSDRVAEQHLRDFVAEHPEFRPTRQRRPST